MIITILLILLALILLAGVGVAIKYHNHQVELKKQQAAQQATDKIVFPVLAAHLPAGTYRKHSQLTSRMWGQGVHAFEYKVDITNCDREALKWLSANQVQAALEAAKAPVPVKITDWWFHQTTLHFDVAYVSNPATQQYLADLKKL
ncbi:hypothetical protein [Limosilactobacillus equigenerosi]|uniref:hypothetical protein n=1 Tax=Limosilactobacillus equigenerosi TaxID=417373 RepID=UPI0007055D47|nr:hypothetical protein [Limosilactobacillus equigenerosi]